MVSPIMENLAKHLYARDAGVLWGIFVSYKQKIPCNGGKAYRSCLFSSIPSKGDHVAIALAPVLCLILKPVKLHA